MYFKPRFPDRRGLTSARWAKDIFRKMSSVRTPTSKPLTKRENSPFLEPQGWFIRDKLLTLQECGFDFCYLLDDLVENPKRSFSPTPPTLPAHVVILPSTPHSWAPQPTTSASATVSTATSVPARVQTPVENRGSESAVRTPLPREIVEARAHKSIIDRVRGNDAEKNDGGTNADGCKIELRPERSTCG